MGVGGVSDSYLCLGFFPPTGLPCTALICGFIVSCKAIFSGYCWEACTFFLFEGGGGVQLILGKEVGKGLGVMEGGETGQDVMYERLKVFKEAIFAFMLHVI